MKNKLIGGGIVDDDTGGVCVVGSYLMISMMMLLPVVFLLLRQSFVALGDLLDPGQVCRDLHVHAGHVHLATANAPGHHSHHVPDSITLTDKRTTAVTLAGILALLTAGADESWVELVAVSQTGVPQLGLALVVRQNWYIDLLENVLVLSVLSEGVLAPTGGPAASSSEVRVLIGQTGGTDVGILGEVHWVVQLEDGQVIVQSSGIVFGVDVHRNHIAFDVGEELHVMVDIPLAQAHTQIEAILTVKRDIVSRLIKGFKDL